MAICFFVNFLLTTQVRSAALNFADLDLKFCWTSLSVGVTGFFVKIFRKGVRPLREEARSINVRLTILSSNEWKEIATIRVFALSFSTIRSKNSDRSFSSWLISIRKAWNTRAAG